MVYICLTTLNTRSMSLTQTQTDDEIIVIHDLLSHHFFHLKRVLDVVHYQYYDNL